VIDAMWECRVALTVDAKQESCVALTTVFYKCPLGMGWASHTTQLVLERAITNIPSHYPSER